MFQDCTLISCHRHPFLMESPWERILFPCKQGQGWSWFREDLTECHALPVLRFWYGSMTRSYRGKELKCRQLPSRCVELHSVAQVTQWHWELLWFLFPKYGNRGTNSGDSKTGSNIGKLCPEVRGVKVILQFIPLSNQELIYCPCFSWKGIFKSPWNLKIPGHLFWVFENW